MKVKKENPRIQNRSIFRSMVIGMLVFSILVIVLLFGGMVAVQLLSFSHEYNDNFPYNITTEDKVQEQLQSVVNINGWIEKLNTQYQVEKVYGIKKTEEYSYSEHRLLSFTNNNDQSEDVYRGFLVPCEEQEGYYLVVIQRDNLKTAHMIRKDKSETSSGATIRMAGMWFIIAAYILICFGIGYYLSKKIQKPLKKISEGIEQIKEGQDNVKLDFYAENEFAQIRDAFNMMSHSIYQSKKKAEETERKKEKMILDLSHDIRTPIATINSCALALKDHMVEEEEKDRYYDIIHRKACRVGILSEDMFTMLKMKSDDYKLSKTKTNICEFLREQCAYYFSDAADKRLELVPDIPEVPIMYEADFGLLARAVGNLITNAIYYNKSGSQIRVGLKEDLQKDNQEDNQNKGNQNKGYQNIEIQVRDDGAQIEKNLRLELFQDFVRGDASRSTSGGTGLGLAITKAIVEKHNGTVYYRYKNNENCFAIILPKNMLIHFRREEKR